MTLARHIPRAHMLDAIHSVAHQAPELSLFAAVIRLAVEDADAGDVNAALWLAGEDCRALLHQVTPAGVDVEAVRRRLLAMVRGLR